MASSVTWSTGVGSLFGLLALLGADVWLDQHIHFAYFAEDAGLPTLIPTGMSLEAVL